MPQSEAEIIIIMEREMTIMTIMMIIMTWQEAAVACNKGWQTLHSLEPHNSVS